MSLAFRLVARIWSPDEMWSTIMTRLLLACCVAVTLYTGQSAGTCREDVFQPQKFKCRDWEDLELIYNKTLIEELIIENPWPFRCDYAAFVLYPRLKYLRLPKGSLMYVGRHCFDGLKQITEIDLKNNDVEEFHFESLNNSTISFLTLTGNILRSLALDGIVVPRLRHLIVAKNQLETLYVERSNFPEIIDISADNNHMHTFFVTSDVLHTLRLSENDIVAFGPEHLTAPRLEYLLLQNNRIRKISVDSFQNIPRIQEISLEGNPLEVVDFSYGNITDFSIHENRLIARKAEWENTFAINLDWRFVQQLRFSHNDIRSYNLLRRLDNGIQELNLDHNKLRKIGEGDVATFTNLFVLDLSHNRIASIHYEAFDRLHRLHTLKLNNNCLQSLSGALFDSLNSLTNINLDTNLLTYFPIPGWNNRTNQIKLTEYHVSMNQVIPNCVLPYE